MENQKKKPLWRKVVDAVAFALFVLVGIVIWLVGAGSVDVPNWFPYALFGAIPVAALVVVLVVRFIMLRKSTTKWRTGSPWDVVKAFYRAVQKGDLNAAYDLFHPDLQQAQDRREFRRLDTDISRLLRKTPRNSSTNTGAQSALVTTYRGSVIGADISSEFLLSMQNDAWEIAAYMAQDELGSIEGGTFHEERGKGLRGFEACSGSLMNSLRAGTGALGCTTLFSLSAEASWWATMHGHGAGLRWGAGM